MEQENNQTLFSEEDHEKFNLLPESVRRSYETRLADITLRMHANDTRYRVEHERIEKDAELLIAEVKELLKQEM